jgi:hypothetical protein
MAKISDLLNEVENERLKVPRFQRGWVWQKRHVREFFNSLYHGYPVGSLIVWPTTSHGQSIDSVIDGQQRLTALYGIINGRTPPWIEDENDSALFGLMFHLDELVFDHAKQVMNNDQRWVDVSALFRDGHVAWAIDYRDRSGKDVDAIYHERIARLIAIRDKDLHIDKLPKDVSPAKAADVFKIVNRAGKSVSEGDLVLGQMSLKWDDAKRQVNDTLEMWRNDSYAISLEQLLHSMSAALEYRINFDVLSNATPEDTIRSFEQVRKATTEVLDHLRNDLGIDSTASTAINNGLIVVVLDRILNGHNILRTRSLIGWWLLSTLHNRWSGDVRNRTNRDVSIVASNGDVSELIRELRAMVPSGSSLEIGIEGFRLTRTSKAYYLLLRSLTRRKGALDLGSGLSLSFDHISPLSKLEAHHIFPRNYLSNCGVEKAQIDQLANLALVTKKINLRIGSKSPVEYLPRLEKLNPKMFAEILASQWIPPDRRLWTVDAYPDFIEERGRLLAEAANQFLRDLIGQEL